MLVLQCIEPTMCRSLDMPDNLVKRRCWASVELMLGQRRGRRTNIYPTVDKLIVLTGKGACRYSVLY